MLRKQVIVLGDEVWEVSREHAYGGNPAGRVAYSHILYCPRCCKQWAALYFPDEKDCWPRGQFCADCGVVGDWNPIAGSLLVEEGYGVIDESLLAALPIPLLRREFELTLKAYSNESRK